MTIDKTMICLAMMICALFALIGFTWGSLLSRDHVDTEKPSYSRVVAMEAIESANEFVSYVEEMQAN